jgi:hypothetical protein
MSLGCHEAPVERHGSRWFKKRSKKKDRKNMKRYEE